MKPSEKSGTLVTEPAVAVNSSDQAGPLPSSPGDFNPVFFHAVTFIFVIVPESLSTPHAPEVDTANPSSDMEVDPTPHSIDQSSTLPGAVSGRPIYVMFKYFLLFFLLVCSLLSLVHLLIRFYISCSSRS